MTRRALVIGSQTTPLEGVNGDASRVAERMASLGFAVDLRLNDRATRAEILAGYARLTAEVLPGDAVVVYYSGHGSYEDLPYGTDAHGKAGRRRCQGIVPYDYAESSVDDYRGILAEELSVLLDGITERTPNVTVLLDCCHSALMSRGRGAVAKAVSHPVRAGVAERLAELASNPVAQKVLGRRQNPLAVRLAAARIEQSAYEYDGDNGQRCGVFTESLLLALDEAKGQEVTWRDLGRRVQERVAQRFGNQQPELEGPVDRPLFEVAEREALDTAGLVRRNGVWRLRRGRILGVRVGDVYAVLPPPTAANGDELGRVRVVKVAAGESEVALDPKAGTEIPGGARARLVESAEPARAVVVPADSDSRAEIVAVIEEGGRFTVVAGGEGAEPALATVRATRGALSILNQDGDAMRHSESVTSALAKLVGNLSNMAHAQALRELAGDGLVNVWTEDIVVEWGLLVEGEERPQPASGASLFEGDRMYFRVKNLCTRDLFVHLLDIGVSDRVATLTGDLYPSGMPLAAGREELVFRDRLTGKADPQEYFWPESVPEDAQRTEQMLFVVTAVPTDLMGLGRAGVRRAAVRGSRLEMLMGQAETGATREVRKKSKGDDFLVKRVTFFAMPTSCARPRGDTAFLVDDRRTAMDLAATPRRSIAFEAVRATVQRATRLAVVLEELVVHKNRAMFGANIRVDALFVTPGAGKSAYTAGTMRFSNVKDGDRLPLDKVLLFMGAARDFVDVCFWVSRDREGSLELAEMLKADANSTEVKAALTALTALAAAAPQAALVVGAFGAATTLAAVSYGLLSKAVGDSVGVYRTSLLEQDGFRVGRHPAKGTLRAQDFSFSIEVRAIG